MAIKINSVTVSETLYNSNVNWALANVGDEIVIETSFTVSTYAIASNDAPFILNNKDGYLPIGSTIWITGGDFKDFRQGDTIQISNYTTGTLTGTTTIVEKLSDNEIRIASNVGSWTANQSGTQDVISVTIPITAVYYQWNFVENNEGVTFLSKTDGSEQIAVRTGLNAAGGGTNLPMTLLGNLDYQFDSVLIDELSLSSSVVYQSNFNIKHRTRVTPLMLAQQWDDLLAGIKPDYFENQNCLKHIMRIEARYTATDPNRIQEILKEDILGNTGWFNENFNTNLTNYTTDTLSYNSGSDKLKLVTTVQTFTFKVKNPTNSPFVSGSTKVRINFAKAPNDESEYTGKNRTLRQNFVWEYADLTVATSPTPVNGQSYGNTNLQSLKNVIATRNSASEITISGQIEFGAGAKAVFEESAEPRYIMFLSIGDHTKTGASSDRVTLLVDKTPFFYATEFPDYLTFTSTIIPHYINELPGVFDEDLPIYEEDECVGYTTFEVTETAETLPLTKQFIRVTGRIVATAESGARFTLEEKTINVANSNYVNDYQLLQSTINTPFHVPKAEIRKFFKASTIDVEIGSYQIAYPFLNRWEYWLSLQGVNSYFFNINQPHNGYNNNWYRYNADGVWGLSFESEVVVKIGGALNKYTWSRPFSIFQRNTHPHITASIKTYDPDTLTELVDGSGNRYILGYKPTLVIADFSQNSGYSYLELGAVMGIEEFEQGGVLGKRRMSSVFESDSDTWFISPLGNGKAESVTTTGVFGEKITVKVLTDHTQLTKHKYKLTGRIYNGREEPAPELDYLVDGIFKVIKDNPINEEPEIVTDKLLDCCSDYVWRVFGKASNPNDELKNDKYTYMLNFDYDVIDNGEPTVIKLYKGGVFQSELTDDSFGKYYEYDFFRNSDNRSFIGYTINWGKVLAEFGAGVYQLEITVTTIFGSEIKQKSDSFCVKEYSEALADKTVRLEYYLTGIIGDSKFDELTTDYGTLNLYNAHRFDGYFMFQKSRYEKDYIRYENGLDEKVTDEQYPEYVLSLEPIPAFKHNRLRTDILQADKILVTDYNTKNFDKYYKKSVQVISEYAPEIIPLKTKCAPIKLNFKPAVNNLKRFRS